MDGWLDRLSNCDRALRINSAAAFQYTSEEGDWRDGTTVKSDSSAKNFAAC